MDTYHTTVNEQGRVLLPAEFRKKIGVKSGDRLVLRLMRGRWVVMTRRQAMDEARAILRKHISPKRRLSAELIAERREEVRREEKQSRKQV